MSKIITFSTVFMKTHPRAGEPTNFVSGIYSSLLKSGNKEYMEYLNPHKHELLKALPEKHHTIRKGSRFKVGEYFSPRMWAGAPYRSKNIAIGPDIKIEKLFDFEIINGDHLVNGRLTSYVEIETIAHNDGLELDDFELWLNHKEFKGQIICWNKNINY